MDSQTPSPRSKRPVRPRPRSRPAQQVGRQRWFEDQLLRVKLASGEQRVELIAALARGSSLSVIERRQILLAVRRYVFVQRTELPGNLGLLLDAVLVLAYPLRLRIKAFELFHLALESLKRDEVVRQLVAPLTELMRPFLPKGAQVEFGPELFMRVAQRLARRPELEGVVELTSLGLFFYPFHGGLRELRADCHYELGSFSAARGDYDRLIEQYPDTLGYRLDRAEASFRLEDYEDALDDVVSYLRHHPEDLAGLRKQAECLYQLGRFLDALKVLTKMMQVDPGRAESYIWRAKVNEQLEFLEDALEDAQKALELEPSSQEARQLRHSLLLKRQSMGMEDDLYNAFVRGEEEMLLGEPKIPEVRFLDIGGLELAKQTLRETIEYPLKYPEISSRYGKKAGGGLLFFGPPGCGKTMLARAAAGECGVAFINVNLATVLDKWVGNTEKAISMIFSAARKRAPSIIFLDEIDAIGASRGSLQAGWEKKLISQLLIELDGLTSDNENVMVLAASNAPWEVDFALRRAGRLGRLVFVPPPGAKERADIFRLYLSRKPYVEEGIDFEALAQITERHSADAIRQIVENAASIPWRAAIETGEARAVSEDDLRASIAQTPPDLAEWEKVVRRYQEFAEQSLKRPAIGFRKAHQKAHPRTE